jgi:hypothetical protein
VRRAPLPGIRFAQQWGVDSALALNGVMKRLSKDRQSVFGFGRQEVIMTEEQLAALLRLKRYEQPPREYFDHLLRDIHLRMRADLLQVRLGRIAMERVRTFLSECSMIHIGYAAALMFALVAAIRMMPSPKAPPVNVDAKTPQPAVTAGEPRYVIDARPPSYEPSWAFSF